MPTVEYQLKSAYETLYIGLQRTAQVNDDINMLDEDIGMNIVVNN